MILPLPRSSMCRPASRQRRKTLDRSTSSTASQSSSLNSRGVGAADDAGVVDEDVETAKPFERARHQRSRLGAAGQVGGERRRLHAVLRRNGGRGSAGSRRLACNAMCAPARASARAMAAPRPRDAPVTSATRPLRSNGVTVDSFDRSHEGTVRQAHRRRLP